MHIDKHGKNLGWKYKPSWQRGRDFLMMKAAFSTPQTHAWTHILAHTSSHIVFSGPFSQVTIQNNTFICPTLLHPKRKMIDYFRNYYKSRGCRKELAMAWVLPPEMLEIPEFAVSLFSVPQVASLFLLPQWKECATSLPDWPAVAMETSSPHTWSTHHAWLTQTEVTGWHLPLVSLLLFSKHLKWTWSDEGHVWESFAAGAVWEFQSIIPVKGRAGQIEICVVLSFP